ncbi:hypothetical protein [Sphingobacterium pedocola]|uniref:hypothetical protein n=1 Tax=Sphingobacterium pedocola TaxID=2082722 RepID=UPI0018CAD006|nr:hypothetical protein [Sphingobacterium pedocola]
MVSWYRRLLSKCWELHILISVLYNLAHLSSSTFAVAWGVAPCFNRVWEPIRTTSFVPRYAEWAGIHGGYSFYSPSVASTYRSHFYIADPNGELHYYSHPLLRSRSAKIRYRSFMDHQKVWIGAKEHNSEVDTAFAYAVQRSLTMQLAKRYPGSPVVHRIMVQHIPSLREHTEQMELKKQVINLKTYRYQYDTLHTHLEPPVTTGDGIDPGLGDDPTLVRFTNTVWTGWDYRQPFAPVAPIGYRLEHLYGGRLSSMDRASLSLMLCSDDSTVSQPFSQFSLIDTTSWVVDQ